MNCSFWLKKEIGPTQCFARINLRSRIAKPKSENLLIEFPAEFESAWGRRYVAHIAGYQYAPRSRLAS